MGDRNLCGPSAPTSINREYEKSKDEYSVNGINVKDLLATKSTLSREEINWMISALENSKIHAMGVAKLHTGGVNQGFCGAVICSEQNMVGIFCHFIRCIDLNAFIPLQSTMLEQQLHPHCSVSYEGDAKLAFNCNQRRIILHFKDLAECKKFYKRVQDCLGDLDPQTSAANAVSKLKLDNPGVPDPQLAAKIEMAQRERSASQPVKPNDGFLADGLSDIIEQARRESEAAKKERNTRNVRGAPRQAQQRPSIPTRSGPGQPMTRGNVSRGRGVSTQRGNTMQRANTGERDITPSQYGTVQRGNNYNKRGLQKNIEIQQPLLRNRSPSLNSVQRDPPKAAPVAPTRPSRAPSHNVIMPRESRIAKWQEKVQRPVPGSVSGDVIVKVQMVKIGAVKTIKFTSNTFVHEVIKRAAKQCAVNPTGLGLYRRSGLELDPDKTLAEEDVISNDILECR